MEDITLTNHAAFGHKIETLNIVIIDNSKTVVGMLRSMLSALKVERIRTYDRTDLALTAIMHEPPNIIITEYSTTPMSGLQFLNILRRNTMKPLCFIPVIVVTSHTTEQRVLQLFQKGAHHVLSKPISAATLQNRVLSLCYDDRKMRCEDEHFVIDGMKEVLEEKKSQLARLTKARLFHNEVIPKAKKSQQMVDAIMLSSDPAISDTHQENKPSAYGMQLAKNLRASSGKRLSGTPKVNFARPSRRRRSR